jgi:hypothetical protein
MKHVHCTANYKGIIILRIVDVPNIEDINLYFVLPKFLANKIGDTFRLSELAFIYN